MKVAEVWERDLCGGRSGAGTLVGGASDNPVQAGDNKADNNKDIVNKCEDLSNRPIRH